MPQQFCRRALSDSAVIYYTCQPCIFWLRSCLNGWRCLSSGSQQQGHTHLLPGCRLCHVQATAAAPHLRTCWRQHYDSHAYDEFQCEWQKALQIMGAPCKLD